MILSIFLVGCSAPKGVNFSVDNEGSVIKGITYNYDKFRQQGWLSTEWYVSSKEEPYVSVKYRSLYEDGNLSFIQLYARMGQSDWCFLNGAYDENGKKYEFHKVDTEISSVAGVVVVFEYFALSLTKEQLEKNALKSIEFKATGKKCDAKFIVDKKMSSAFLKTINQRATKQP
jgi:hypothetical protein